MDVFPRRGDVYGVGVQSLHQIAVVGKQRGREPTVAAAQMHHQPAANARSIQDLPSRVAGIGNDGRQQEQGDRQQSRTTF